MVSWLLQAAFVLPIEPPRAWGLRLRTELREGLETAETSRLSSTELRPGGRFFWSSTRFRLQLDELLTLRSFSHRLDEHRIEHSTLLSLSYDVSPNILCSLEALRFSGEASAAVEALGSAGLLLAGQQGSLARISLAARCAQEIAPRLQWITEVFWRNETSEESSLSLTKPSVGFVYAIPTGELGITSAFLWADTGSALELRAGARHDLSETLSLRAELGTTALSLSGADLVALASVVLLRSWGSANLSLSRDLTPVLSQGLVSVLRGYASIDGYLSPRLTTSLQIGQSYTQEEQSNVLEVSLRRKLLDALWLSLRYSWQQEQDESKRESRRLVFVGLIGAIASGQIPRSGLAALGNW